MMRVAADQKDSPQLATGGQDIRSDNSKKPTIKAQSGQSFLETPPHAPDLEKSLIVSMLIDPSAIDEVKEIIIPQDCYQTRHAGPDSEKQSPEPNPPME